MASPTVGASPAKGETATSVQFKSLAEQATSPAPISASPTQARRPQRKVSVFSHNGFQQLDQLDQASVRQHSQDQQQQHQSQGSSADSTKEVCIDKARTPRTDTLGSTGSSRASSCDEPTIVQQAGAVKPTPLEASSSSSSAALERDEKRSSKSSSNSSLDSLSATNSEQKKFPIPPFESIKSQLRQNLVPDAEFMRQHIDKLISHNEAVIDNCHLVNIRSYNSNNNTASLSPRRQTSTTTTTTTNVIEQQQRQELKLDQESGVTAKRTKRWSTTAIGSNTVGITFSEVQQVGALSAQTSPSKQVRLPHQKSSSLERKRSCNISAPSLEPIFQHQRLDLRCNNFSEQQQKAPSYGCDIENLSLKPKQQTDIENIFRQHILLQQQQQQQQPLDLATIKMQQLDQRQQEQDMFMTALIESQRQQQLHESQLLNDYLSKLMLNGQSNSSLDKFLSTNPANNPTATQQQHPQLPESPAHRCEACDISFWTQDLLNYHSITQCTARRGPQLARPLAFNFVGPNNFDSLATQQQLYTSTSNVRSGSSNNINSANNFLSVPPSFQSRPLARQAHRHSHHQLLTCQAQSKSASPPNERYPNELALAAVGAEVADKSTGYKQEVGAEKGTIAASATTTTTTMASTVSAGSTMLPFKKRKISEPNMRY